MKIVGLVILVAITGCKKPDTAAQAAPLPPLVTISDPEIRDVMRYMTTTGRTRAVASVEVRARVVGFLEEMKYEPGEIVKEGDLLFVMANLGRHLGLDPEQALRRANAKFTRRFEGVEARLAAMGKTPAQSDLAEMDALWDAVKAAEKAG